MIAKPRLGSRRVVERHAGRTRLIGAHYTPFRAWMIGFRTIDEMQDLNQVAW
jgi:hypothetical protein